MFGISGKTRVYAFRLTNEVAEILERRVQRSKRWKNVQSYIRERIENDALRKR